MDRIALVLHQHFELLRESKKPFIRVDAAKTHIFTMVRDVLKPFLHLGSQTLRRPFLSTTALVLRADFPYLPHVGCFDPNTDAIIINDPITILQYVKTHSGQFMVRSMLSLTHFLLGKSHFASQMMAIVLVHEAVHAWQFGTGIEHMDTCVQEGHATAVATAAAQAAGPGFARADQFGFYLLTSIVSPKGAISYGNSRLPFSVCYGKVAVQNKDRLTHYIEPRVLQGVVDDTGDILVHVTRNPLAGLGKPVTEVAGTAPTVTENPLFRRALRKKKRMIMP